MARRLYLGRLPPDARSEDVNKFFEGYGHIVDCRVMTGFGFVEFESSKEAEDALATFNDKPFMGSNIVIEFAKESRPRREPQEERGYGAARSRRPPGVRILVSGISRDTSWQDLKDFGRDAGSVSFSDIDRDVPNQGILEYLGREDADRAVRELDGRELRGKTVRVVLDDSRGGPDNYRRDDRGDRGYREDRYDRGDRPPRRDRSRSPAPRRDYDDRRYRSPPPARRDYDERRPAGYDDYYSRDGYDDRKYPNYDYDRRRDEPRRDDRRRESRYDDRPPREERPREDRPPRDAPRDAPREDRPPRSNDGSWAR